MPIFVSYSRADEEPVKALAQGFELARREVWFDRDLGGGEAWWDEILDNIRSASVFVFALSDSSIHSKPCRSELDYALALGRSILPVQVGAVGSFRGNPLADRQTLFYRPDEALSAFEIIAAVDEAASTIPPLPDPLPAPPPIPFAYLLALGRQIDTTELNHADQLAVVDQLRRALGEETDQSVRRDIASMLKNLANKPWATRRTENEVRAVIYAFMPPLVDPATHADDETTDHETTDHETAVSPKEEDVSSDAEDLADPPRADAPDAAAKASEPDGRMLFEQRLLELSKRQDDQLRTESQRRATADGRPDYAGRDRKAPAVAPIPASAPAPTPAPTPAPIWTGVAQPLVAPPRWESPPPSPSGQAGRGTPRVNARVPAARPAPVAPTQRPSAYWPLSVLALISVIFGIVAIVYSARTDRLVGEGDIATARKASSWALAWGIVGIVVGGLFWISLLV